jgi:hypothetical protein
MRGDCCYGTVTRDLPSLFRIPLEIRHIIYEMLLTTTYNTALDPTGCELGFHLHPAILLVDKEVNKEATKILHQKKYFITVKVSGLSSFLHEVPKSKRLSVEMIPKLVLEVKIAIADDTRLQVDNTQTLITTPEGIQALVKNLWSFDAEHDNALICRHPNDGTHPAGWFHLCD